MKCYGKERECLSGEILLARTLLSARSGEGAVLRREVKENLDVPIVGVISDGQQSKRTSSRNSLAWSSSWSVSFSLSTVSFKVIYAADRHAKKELKKQVRGVRGIERSVASNDDPVPFTVLGYCLAVRSALTDDGRPPLEPSGLKLRSRLTLIEQ